MHTLADSLTKDMNVDLYHDDLSSVSGPHLHSAIENFIRNSESIESRPREGYLLDFKREWGESALRTVAAFANTFGGLLIVGITGKEGRPDEIVGVSSPQSELKTRIASAIAGNISPTPPFGIAECAMPTDVERKLCVIRVRSGSALHLLTKKGEQPVYVRNEDESRPADAAQLRSLIERRYDANRIESEVPNRIVGMQQALVVNYSGRLVSPTHLRISLIPLSRTRVDLDLSFEKHFENRIYDNYPTLRKRLERAVAEDSEERGRDWYELRWRYTGEDFERRWRITADCDFGFVTQIHLSSPKHSGYWSLYDIAVDVICTIQATRAVWEAAGYYGESRLHADLSVGGLELFTPEIFPHGLASLFTEMTTR